MVKRLRETCFEIFAQWYGMGGQESYEKQAGWAQAREQRATKDRTIAGAADR